MPTSYLTGAINQKIVQTNLGSERTGIYKFGSSAHGGVLKAMGLYEVKYGQNIDRRKAQTKI